MLKTWKLTNTSVAKINFADASSLDAITRQLPDGYYSTFRTFDGCTRVLGLADHLRRLYEPVPRPEVDASTLRQQLFTLLGPYRPGEARVRIVMTKEGQAYVAATPLTLLSREIFKKGVRVETTDLQRESPRLKSTAFIDASDTERRHIAQEGIFEALLVKNGKILEGMTSNFFYIPRAERRMSEAKSVDEAQVPTHASSSPYGPAQREATLGTARDDILLGITRKTVIDVALSEGLEVKYQPLKRDQLAAVEEAFITSSSRGIVPVIRVDDVTIGDGRPGPITKQLMAAYETYVIEKAEKILPDA